MRVLHVITGLGRGGAELALCRLVAAQENPSSHMVVSIAAPSDCKELLLKHGVNVVQLDASTAFRRLKMPFRVFSEIRRFRPSVVQTWMYHADLIGGIAGVLSGVPVCWGLRSGDVASRARKRSTRIVALVCGLLSRWIPARIISCSASAVEAHRRLGYVGKFRVIPNGVVPAVWCVEMQEREKMRGDLGFVASDLVYVHVGRGHPVKNQKALALAFNCVHAAKSSARLILVGRNLEQENEYFEALPFMTSAKSAVVGLGQRDDLPRILSAADIFVLTSDIEGFPNVVVEAMAAGLPCIVTDAGDSAEIVGSTGIVVPPGDVDAIANAMLSMAESSYIDRERLGAAARARVLSNFTVARMAAEFQAVWKDVGSTGAYPCVG